MTFRAIASSFASAVTATLGLAGTALACAFHNYIPDETLVDKMLGSEHIVLARQDPDNPFRYKAVEALVGSVEHVELPQLVDSITRRKLRASPNDTVLFARPDPYGPWERLAYLDQDFRAVIDQVAASLEDWQYGGDEARYQLFADAFNHPNPELHVLALRELDRAPYDLLQTLSVQPDVSIILSQIWLPDMAEFLPIHVLLLGLSGDNDALPVLQAGLEASLTLQNTIFTGAWSTALIELQGADAIEAIGNRLLTDLNLTPDNREALVESLAIHALSGAPAMQAQIDALVTRALETDVAFAPMVARQFGSRAIWTQADNLNRLLRSGALKSASALISVSHYLSVATQMQADSETTSN